MLCLAYVVTGHDKITENESLHSISQNSVPESATAIDKGGNTGKYPCSAACAIIYHFSNPSKTQVRCRICQNRKKFEQIIEFFTLFWIKALSVLRDFKHDLYYLIVFDMFPPFQNCYTHLYAAKLL